MVLGRRDIIFRFRPQQCPVLWISYDLNLYSTAGCHRRGTACLHIRKWTMTCSIQMVVRSAVTVLVGLLGVDKTVARDA